MSVFRLFDRHNIRILFHGFFHPGFCPVCERTTLFFRPFPYAPAMREYYRCARCRSLPRYRALNFVLQQHFPEWRNLAIHESSPGGPLSQKLKRLCRAYVASNYLPDMPAGAHAGQSRNENLQAQTFSDNVFDLVVTMDVFEHLPHPDLAFQEIARTLKPGGAHVFTVPCTFNAETVVKASATASGAIEHHKPPVYHGNPINARGSLVFRDWGRDIVDFIKTSCGFDTDVVRMRNLWYGIEPTWNEVFVSRKPLENAPSKHTGAI